MLKMTQTSRKGTTKSLSIGPGRLYKGFGDIHNLGERVGATKGGTKFTIETEYHVSEIDGVLGPVKGARWKTGVVPQIESNLLEMTKENMLMQIPSLRVFPSDDDYDVLCESGVLTDLDYDNYAIVGRITGRKDPIILVIYNAIMTENWGWDGNTGKDDIVFPIKLTGHYDEEDTHQAPYSIYFPKKDFEAIPGFHCIGCEPDMPDPPTANPASGHNFINSGQVALSSTEGVIHYTTNGSTPTIASPTYSSPISVTSNTTIKAIVQVDGIVSDVATFTYTVSSIAMPTANPAPGNYAGGSLDVTLQTAQAGGTIYYTTNGATPDKNSDEYVSEIELLTGTTTIKAVTYIEVDGTDYYSSVATFVYIVEAYIQNNDMALPEASPPEGVVASGTDVTLTTSEIGGSVYYTISTDGNPPPQPFTAAGIEFTTPINLTQNAIIRAISVVGDTRSPVVEFNYTIA